MFGFQITDLTEEERSYWTKQDQEELGCTLQLNTQVDSIDIFSDYDRHDFDALVRVLQRFLKERRPRSHIAFGYADLAECRYGCGGGALVVAAEEVKSFHTDTWIDETLEEIPVGGDSNLCSKRWPVTRPRRRSPR
jgi:hypothetical protein